MECKSKKRIGPVDATLVLIETLWNVNLADAFETAGCDEVLIETLWNVNADPDGGRYRLGAVLIETLWNVNVQTLQYSI